jgi:hypothetical protein
VPLSVDLLKRLWRRVSSAVLPTNPSANVASIYVDHIYICYSYIQPPMPSKAAP